MKREHGLAAALFVSMLAAGIVVHNTAAENRVGLSAPLEIWFSSSEDPVAALRPRLRISYTSKVPLGLP